jgi:type III secretory pathway component EscS
MSYLRISLLSLFILGGSISHTGLNAQSSSDRCGQKIAKIVFPLCAGFTSFFLTNFLVGHLDFVKMCSLQSAVYPCHIAARIAEMVTMASLIGFVIGAADEVTSGQGQTFNEKKFVEVTVPLFLTGAIIGFSALMLDKWRKLSITV